jgi:hypothetical protein
MPRPPRAAVKAAGNIINSGGIGGKTSPARISVATPNRAGPLEKSGDLTGRACPAASGPAIRSRESRSEIKIGAGVAPSFHRR